MRKQIFCVGQSVAVTIQTVHGYGHRASTLSEHQLDIILKVSFMGVYFSTY